MRILLIGDIVGRPGRRIVERCLRGLRKRENLSCVIANGENSAEPGRLRLGYSFPQFEKHSFLCQSDFQ